MALADLDAGLQRQPDNFAGLLARALIKQDKGDATGAIADYDAVLKGEPANTKAYYQRGLAREKVSQYEGAVADFRMALARDANMADARKALARALAMTPREKSRLAEGNVKSEVRAAPDSKESDKSTGAIAGNPNVRLPPAPEKKSADVVLQKDAGKPAQKMRETEKSQEPIKLQETKIEETKNQKPSEKLVRYERERKTAEHHGKKHEKEARAQRQRHRTAQAIERRRIVVQSNEPRYIRAGSEDSRRMGSRDTRFTDIWNDRR
jgi:tetratricopeptide (TPR) repeat protein